MTSTRAPRNVDADRAHAWKSVAVAAFVILGTLAWDFVFDLPTLSIGAIVVALVAVSALLIHYHRTTPWWRTPVGRTTMGLKASIWLLAVSALLRRASVAWPGVPWLGHLFDVSITVAWSFVAVAVVERYRVIVALQKRSKTTNRKDLP